MDAKVYRNMPFDAYRALPGMNQSTLGKGGRSMAHMRHAMDNPSEPSDAMNLGSAFHCLTTEPDAFSERFVVAPKIDRRTNAGKAEWERIQSSGLAVLTQEQHESASAMASSLRAIPLVSDIIALRPEIELVITWADDATGVLCKCRLDAMLTRTAPLVVLDLKSTRDARPGPFAKSVVSYGYHIQAAMYSDAVLDAWGESPKFIFACVENTPPFASAIYELSSAALDAGRRIYTGLLERYQACLASGEWPAYPTDIQQLRLPSWAEVEE